MDIIALIFIKCFMSILFVCVCRNVRFMLLHEGMELVVVKGFV